MTIRRKGIPLSADNTLRHVRRFGELACTSAKTRERFVEPRIGPIRFNDRDVRYGCAPWQGGAFQWVQVPPGERSGRKQPEQLLR